MLSVPLLSDQFIREYNSTEILLFTYLSILTVILLGTFALFKLKVFNIFRTFSGVVGDEKNLFVLMFPKKELKVL